MLKKIAISSWRNYPFKRNSRMYLKKKSERIFEGLFEEPSGKISEGNNQ